MKSRLARLGVLLLPVMAVMATLAPSSNAAAAGALVIVGTANVGAGIAYPCVEPGATPLPINVNKCLGPLGSPPNSAPVTFNGTGVGAVLNALEGKCATTPTNPVCLEAGTVVITAAGTVVGACGFSTGTLGAGNTGTITPAISVGNKAKPRNFSVTYIGVGGFLILTGTTTKGETIAGAVVAVPTGGSCTNKDPKVFTVAGAVAIAKAP
jgi:hypothetical protein